MAKIVCHNFSYSNTQCIDHSTGKSPSSKGYDYFIGEILHIQHIKSSNIDFYTIF